MSELRFFRQGERVIGIYGDVMSVVVIVPSGKEEKNVLNELIADKRQVPSSIPRFSKSMCEAASLSRR
jgi:hypothetical protein